MGEGVNAYWVGISEQQLASQPGFYNDDIEAFANRAETEGAKKMTLEVN